MFNRRDFIKFMSLMGGVALNPFQRFGNWSGLAADMIQESIEGELYAGFLLLPEESHLPSIVKPPKHIPPYGDNPRSKFNGVTYYYDSEIDLARKVNFPVYTLNKTIKNIHLVNTSSYENQEGYVYEIGIGFEMYQPASEIWKPWISIHAESDYLTPYPVFFLESHDTITEFNDLRIDIHNNPGILLRTSMGFVLHWIEENIHYSFLVEPCPKNITPDQLIDKLVKIIPN
jgi:hypothetical protein